MSVEESASVAAASAPSAASVRMLSVPLLRGPDCVRSGDAMLPLTDVEERMLALLLDVVRHAGTSTCVRVAGGWVRDKLLGRVECTDIDIALDNCTGQVFANLVNDYLRMRGERTNSVGVIAANPDQSKHLETATTRVLGVWVDFVHLRSETYDTACRIPTVTIGTPLQDAERRDFTVNSLFYNVTLGAIEDWTGQGLEDLRSQILRTPLPPMVTFLDDPLRVLRAVRFASRFGFRMVPELTDAARHPDVKTALAMKVSRERVGVEVEKMLSGQRPVAAVRVLHAFHLADTVFAMPRDGTLVGPVHFHAVNPALPAIAALSGGVGEIAVSGDAASALPPAWLTASAQLVETLHATMRTCGFLLHYLREDGRLRVRGALSSLDVRALCTGISGFCAVRAAHIAPEAHDEFTPSMPEFTPEHRHVLMLAAALYPLHALQYVNKKGRAESCVFHVVLDSLKRKHKDGEDVVAVLRGVQVFRENLVTRDVLALGMAIRNEVKGLWPLSLLLAIAVDLEPVYYYAAFQGAPDAFSTAAPLAHPVLAAYMQYVEVIDRFELHACWTRKPLLNGKQLMSELGLGSGKEVGVYVDEHARWQLLNPSGPSGSIEAAVGHLRGMRETGIRAEQKW